VKRRIWSWGCPLKLKIFIWLLLEDKILTWNNLLKRGWIGPGYCYLCKGNEETTNHLFSHCPFMTSIWGSLCTHLKVQNAWTGPTIKDCFDSWFSRNANLPSFPAFICWFVWNESNLAIFYSKSSSMEKFMFLSIAVIASLK